MSRPRGQGCAADRWRPDGARRHRRTVRDARRRRSLRCRQSRTGIALPAIRSPMRRRSARPICAPAASRRRRNQRHRLPGARAEARTGLVRPPRPRRPCRRDALLDRRQGERARRPAPHRRASATGDRSSPAGANARRPPRDLNSRPPRDMRLARPGHAAPGHAITTGFAGEPSSGARGSNAASCPISTLSVAVGDYDRNRPLINGAVRIDGVDPVFMTLSPEEIFFRAFRSVISIFANCRCRASR